MLNRWIILTLVMGIVISVACNKDQAQEKNQVKSATPGGPIVITEENPQGPIVITGTLKSVSGEPIAGERLNVNEIKRDEKGKISGVTITFTTDPEKEKKWVTASDGAFKMEISRDLARGGNELLLVTRSSFNGVIEKKGANLSTFKVDEKTAEVRLGDITVKYDIKW